MFGFVFYDFCCVRRLLKNECILLFYSKEKKQQGWFVDDDRDNTHVSGETFLMIHFYQCSKLELSRKCVG